MPYTRTSRISPSHRNGPKQEQRKTLTSVGVKPTTFRIDQVALLTELYIRPVGHRLELKTLCSGKQS